MFFVEAPGADLNIDREWVQRVLRVNAVDLREWFPYGAAMLGEADVRTRVAELGDHLWDRIARARRSQTAVGNLSRFNPYFTGRTTQLSALHSTLVSGDSVGVVTAVAGLGGIGKTELAVQYAHMWRDRYRAGVWLLNAEDLTVMLPLLARLAEARGFGWAPVEQADPEAVGMLVLAELRRRAESDGASVLVILDNVSEPELLAEPQTALLPEQDRLHFVATTRLGETDFPSGKGRLALYQEATDIRRGLVTTQPDNLNFQRDLGIVLGAWANLLQVGQPARADALYQEAIETARGLVTAQPDNLDFQRGLGIVLFDFAGFCEEEHDPAGAGTLWMQALPSVARSGCPPSIGPG